jgi:hypothetical protein
MANLLHRARALRRAGILGFLVLALALMPAGALASPGGHSPQAAISLSGSYAQDFDTLANSGSANVWADDGTLAGWYATEDEYRASTGSSTAGALYSFGDAGSAERALGSLASGTTGTIHYGARFVNDTGLTVTSLTVTYTGEQWRDSGNTSQHTLEFSFQVGATVDDLTSGTWTDVDALDFTGPAASGSSGALDGNAAANRTTLSQAIAIAIPPGQEIMLRWTDVNDDGSDHGLGIDDLAISEPVLAVTLADFAATAAGDHILVAWETTSELDNAGFNLYRGATGAAPEERLAFIPSQAPGSTQGASYGWPDMDVAAGDTYWYWLEDVDLSGATTMHGPVSATLQAPTAVRLAGLEAGSSPAAGGITLWVAAGLVVLSAATTSAWTWRRSR